MFRSIGNRIEVKMIDDYDKQERIAIKIDSSIPKHLAIKQTEQEMKSKEFPESIAKAKALQQKIKEDRASKRSLPDGKSKAAGI